MSLSWAWRTSKQLHGSSKLRVKFVVAAARRPSLVRRLMMADPTSGLGSILAERPDTVGALIWPYQCSAWTPEQRFEKIEDHFEAVKRVTGLQLAPDEKLVVQDLSWVSPETTLILDRPEWLAREGHLTLSLFKNDFRAFTLSFSVSAKPELTVFIGGIQGRQDVDILSLYRDLTKNFHGMRPRDLMLETFRILAVSLKVKHIHAIADAYKISRHSYFGKRPAPGLFYDDIWEERGGLRVAETHFELPIDVARRNLDDVSSKKRSMYRKRYEMLDRIAAQMPEDLALADRRHFMAK